jgi:hypothetical protein
VKCNYKNICKGCTNCSWFDFCLYADREARAVPVGRGVFVLNLPLNHHSLRRDKRESRALGKGGVSVSVPPRAAVKVTNKLDT